MKKLIITLLCLAVVCGGGYFGYTAYQKNKDSKRIVDVVPISLLSESYWNDEKTLDAIVAAGNSQNVYLDSEKLIKKLNVSVGDEVKKGDVILTYDMTVMELETEQKKNQIALIEQQIKEEERELTRIKGLLPSELAPQESFTPDYGFGEPEYPMPEEPEEPQQPDPVKVLESLLNPDQAAEISAEGAYVFYCGSNTVVSSSFMGMLKMIGRRAFLYVYDESASRVMYFWDVNGTELTDEDIVDWVVSDGVEFDGSAVYFNSEAASAHGIFKGFDPTANSGEDEQSPEEDLPYDEGFEDPGFFDGGYSEPSFVETGENYLYTRAELATMIKAKENEIQKLGINLKSAKLDYEDSLTRKKDGKVVAEIDGKVIKAGEEADSETNTGEDSAYIVIQGNEGVCIDISVNELDLDTFAPGTLVSGMSWETGESFTAEVIELKTEPQYYFAWDWRENPDSSTYIARATVLEDTSLRVNNYVQVNMPQAETASNSMCIPLHYTHKDSGGYYVMKDDGGKLSKQYLNTGKVVWGSLIEVKGGISYDDLICFPYGKDVKEGIATKRSEKVLY